MMGLLRLATKRPGMLGRRAGARRTVLPLLTREARTHPGFAPLIAALPDPNGLFLGIFTDRLRPARCRHRPASTRRCQASGPPGLVVKQSNEFPARLVLATLKAEVGRSLCQASNWT